MALAAVQETRLKREGAEEIVRKERVVMKWGGQWRELLFVLGPLRIPRADVRGGGWGCGSGKTYGQKRALG